MDFFSPDPLFFAEKRGPKNPNFPPKIGLLRWGTIRNPKGTIISVFRVKTGGVLWWGALGSVSGIGSIFRIHNADEARRE